MYICYDDKQVMIKKAWIMYQKPLNAFLVYIISLKHNNDNFTNCAVNQSKYP